MTIKGDNTLCLTQRLAHSNTIIILYVFVEFTPPLFSGERISPHLSPEKERRVRWGEEDKNLGRKF